MSTPFTPTGSRKSHLILSHKQYSKIAGTIASVRRTRRGGVGDNLDEEDEDEYTNGANSPDHPAPGEPSFIAEASFVRAPLNSRVAARLQPIRRKEKGHADSLEGVPLQVQEAMILEDLLFVLMGIEGTHITYDQEEFPEDDHALLKGIRFIISPSLDISLRDLVDRIVPLATYHSAISAFVQLRSHLDYGLVNHALCAAIRDMLKDYHTLLSQLEHAFSTSPSFTLQKFWFYVHPTLHTLSLLYSLVTEIAQVDDPDGDSSSDISSSSSDAARNEELGLGSGLKAVLSEMEMGSGGVAKGGEVVAVIWDRMTNMSGDPTAHQLYRRLLRAASLPYAQMLQRWIRTGHLKDPCEELMVKESKFINRGTLEMDYTDEYWERRYTLRDGSSLSAPSKRHQAGVPLPRTPGGRLPGGACVPPFIEGWKHKILLAGKYLNVIRECGIDVRGTNEDFLKEEMDMDDEKFYRSIEDAYSYANRTLLKLLLEDQQLVPRLRSLKHYFFLSQSSFLTHFLDLAHSELRKPAKSASIVKLQSFLDLALNNGSFDPLAHYREDVKVTMANSGLYDWLLKVVSVSGAIGGEGDEFAGAVTAAEAVDEGGKDKEKEKKQLQGIDALALDYTVKFPLSLVISRKTILRYQLLFRFLLHLKHVEQQLTAMWADHKSAAWRTPVPTHTEFERWRTRVFILRARMLAFVQQILAFATFEVLEPNWRSLEAKLEKVKTVDQLLRDHVDFLDTCLKECMLTSSKLLRVYSRMLVTCLTFALYSGHFTKSVNQGLAALKESDGDPDSAPMQKRWEFLEKFETNFKHFSKVHLDCVQFYASSENVALLALVIRLNSVQPST